MDVACAGSGGTGGGYAVNGGWMPLLLGWGLLSKTYGPYAGQMLLWGRCGPWGILEKSVAWAEAGHWGGKATERGSAGAHDGREMGPQGIAWRGGGGERCEPG